MPGPRLPEETLQKLRALHNEFLELLRSMGYTDNAINTYDQYPTNFIRWLEGSWEPPGPKGQHKRG